MSPPEALILAGPNGAGKTSVSGVLVPDGMLFLNSDVVVARLLGEGHGAAGVEIAAGRVVLTQLRDAVAAGKSFCIETNLAGRGFVHWIHAWREHGYSVELAFTTLDSPDLAVRRVAGRVADGGHDVPEAVIRRRWAAGLRALFDLYLPLVDRWVVFDNSDEQLRLVAEGGSNGRATYVADQQRWGKVLTLAADVGAQAPGFTR